MFNVISFGDNIKLLHILIFATASFFLSHDHFYILHFSTSSYLQVSSF